MAERLMNARYHALYGVFLLCALACLVIAQLVGSRLAAITGWSFTAAFAVLAAVLYMSRHPRLQYRLFPEIARFPEDARSGTLESACSIAKTWSRILIAAVFVSSALALWIVFLYRLSVSSEWILVLQLLILLADQLPILIKRLAIRRLLRRKLRTYGIVLCVECGYDLKGSLSSDCCPECGTRFAEQTARCETGPTSSSGR